MSAHVRTRQQNAQPLPRKRGIERFASWPSTPGSELRACSGHVTTIVVELPPEVDTTFRWLLVVRHDPQIARRLVSALGRRNVQGLTHQQLAELIGSYRETVTVTLNHVRAEGYIDFGRRRITLLQPDGLESTAESWTNARSAPLRPPVS